ncbi:MAG: menaquinol-cytochrome C reductase, partial [Planctomycetota bacterium]
MKLCKGIRTWLADRLCCPNPEACETASPGRAWWTLGMSVTAFLLCVQAITGFVLWAYYSPSAQTAWESVYFIQYEVPLGWLVRGIHFWTAQVLVGWLGLYVTWLIVRGLVRAPREFVYWTAL